MRRYMPRVHVRVHVTCACARAAVCGPYTRLDIVVVALGDGVRGLEGGADDQPRRQQLRRHRLAWWWNAAKQPTSTSWAAAPYRSSLIPRLSPECTTPVSSPGTSRVLRVLGVCLGLEQGLEIAPDCTTGSSRITPVRPGLALEAGRAARRERGRRGCLRDECRRRPERQGPPWHAVRAAGASWVAGRSAGCARGETGCANLH